MTAATTKTPEVRVELTPRRLLLFVFWPLIVGAVLALVAAVLVLAWPATLTTVFNLDWTDTKGDPLGPDA